MRETFKTCFISPARKEVERSLLSTSLAGQDNRHFPGCQPDSAMAGFINCLTRLPQALSNLTVALPGLFSGYLSGNLRANDAKRKRFSLIELQENLLDSMCFNSPPNSSEFFVWPGLSVQVFQR